jgi:hypothetical protein
LNTFEAILHSGYLCLKVPAIFDIITIFGGQKEARHIERGFATGHKNMHFLREVTQRREQVQPPSKQETPTEFKKAIEVEGDFKQVALNPRVPDKVIYVGTEMISKEQAELLQFLDKSSDIFVWSTSDLVGSAEK